MDLGPLGISAANQRMEPITGRAGRRSNSVPLTRCSSGVIFMVRSWGRGSLYAQTNEPS